MGKGSPAAGTGSQGLLREELRALSLVPAGFLELLLLGGLGNPLQMFLHLSLMLHEEGVQLPVWLE